MDKNMKQHFIGDSEMTSIWKNIQYHYPLEEWKLKSQSDAIAHLSEWLKKVIPLTVDEYPVS